MKKIKCTYGTLCEVSVEKLNNQNVLKIDFNIKEFKVLQNGWQDFSFPSNVSINDKLYLDEALKDKVVSILDDFIKTGGIESINKTKRGFTFLDIEDLMGNTISIQQSSSASEPKIWFGSKTENKAYSWKNDKITPYIYPAGDVSIADRLHLNRTKAQQLKNAINNVWQLQLNIEESIKPTDKVKEVKKLSIG